LQAPKSKLQALQLTLQALQWKFLQEKKFSGILLW